MGKRKRGRSRNPSYRVVYLMQARRRFTEELPSLDYATKVVRQFKRRGMTSWVETTKGKFVPIKGQSRRPSYIDEQGQSVEMGPRGQPAENPPLLPGAPPQYVMGSMGAQQIWTYLGYEIQVYDAIPPTGEWRACFDLGSGPRSKQDWRCGRGHDPQEALTDARHIIDVWWLGPVWISAELVVDDAIDDYMGKTKDPVTRPRIARHIELLSRKEWKGNAHVRDFQGLSVQDRVRLIDAVIAKYERSGAFAPESNPDRIKLKIVHRPGGEMLLRKTGRTLEVSGTEIRRLLRDQDRIGGAKVAEILGAVAPIHECDFGGASPGYDCYSKHYDVPDFERQLEKFAKPDGAGWLWTLKRGPKPNPLLPGPPPQYVMGNVNMGIPELWRYRGREIEVSERVVGGLRDFVACYDDPVEQMRPCHFGPDVQAALAHARHEIDLSDMPEGWRRAERLIHGVLDHYVDQTTGPINRGRIARHLEEILRDPRPSQGYVNEFDLDEGLKAFYDLALPDRLRLIDEVIEEQQLLDMFDPARRTSNPHEKMVATVAELVAW